MDLERINELGFEKTSKWKTIVLIVSFTQWWNLLIAIQSYIVFLVCLTNLAFHYQSTNLDIIRYTFDLFYLFEIIFTLSYRSNVRYRKLKHSFGRSWFLVIVDIISVLPFETIYYFHYYTGNERVQGTRGSDMQKILIQNRLLRIYRIFQLESLYEITVSKRSRYLFFMLILFTSKALLLAHILCCIWVNLKQSNPCHGKRMTCFVWYETNMATLVILNWAGSRDTFRNVWERLLVTVGIFLGVLLIYGYFYPMVFHVSMQFNYGRAYYFDRHQKLLRLLQNMIKKQELRKGVLKDVTDSWKSSNNVLPYMDNIPLCLKKEIFTDIYWEAFRHSEILREVSRSCKRSLSLVMVTHHYHAGEIIYTKGQKKDKMLFLIQGTVQVMAEENEKSALLSFSSGTIIGESSLFLSTNSQAIVKCMSFCEVQILPMVAVFRVLQDYPKDKKRVFQKLQQRLLLGQYTQWRKSEFQEQNTASIDSTVEDCVKWFKTQWSAVWENHKRQLLVIKALEEGQRIPSFHRAIKPDVKIEFVSNFLELVVLSDAFEEKKDAVCLRTNFPWSIDPSAGFLKLWFKMILFISFIPAVSYPLCTVWLSDFPTWVYELSYIITAVYLVDVIIKLFTAVRTKHVTHTQFMAVLRHRLKEPTFYLDVLAAFPYQIFIIRNEEIHPHQIGLFLHPAILKFHVFINLEIPMSTSMAKLTLIKNCLIFLFLLYFFSEWIQLLYEDRKDIRDPAATNWITGFGDGRGGEEFPDYFLSVVKALSNALSIPNFLVYPKETSVLLVNCVSKYFFFFFFCYFVGDFYGAYMVRIFSEETFLVLLKRIINFLNGVYIPKKLTHQLLKTVKFQWIYDNADYLSTELPIIKSMPFDLRRQIYSDGAYKTLRMCKIFELESEDCLVQFMEKSFIVAVPAGSLLVSYGHTSHMLSILHRGVCQISSFLVEDNVAGVGWPIVVRAGYAFPLLSSLCNVPAPVAVVSLTDCEVIMIHLDDLLQVFMDYNILKDVLDVLKELDLLEKLKLMKPGLIGFDENRTVEPKVVQSKIFVWMGPYAAFFSLCFGGTRFTDNSFIKKWEFFFSVYLMVFFIVWPTCFGLFAYASHILVPILLFSKIFVILNFFFSFRTPFYNKIGILVTHPLHTIWNYLTSNFLVDVFCFFPVYPIFRYRMPDPTKKLPVWLITFDFLQIFLKLIHLLGYLDTLKYIYNSKYAIRMTKIIVSVLIGFNLFANYMMYILADWIYGSSYQIIGFNLPKKYSPKNPKLLEKNSLFDYYIFITYWMLVNWSTNDFDLNVPKEILFYVGYVLNVVGTILSFYLYCWIASNSFFTYLGETLFQEKIMSLVKFLETEDANDKVIEKALSFYNYEWSKTRGENLKNIFERLPTHLHEELVYPLYRKTLKKCDIFARVDEGFYKILAKYLSCVYFNRGSVIIFQNEVQSDLYFIHKGKCFVYDWYLILDVGSLIGDIKRKGLMENKIYALTNVELLKISTDDFFMIINNFDDLEAEFFKMAKNLDNFIRSRSSWSSWSTSSSSAAATSATGTNFRLHPVDSKDVLHAFGLQGKVIGFEDESYFEETDKSSLLMRKTLRYKAEEKKRIFTIYPDTWKMKVYVFLRQVDAFLTVVFIPILAQFATLTKEAFSVVGVLDFFWFLGIVSSFRVGYIDKVKGDVITDFKFVAKHYVKRWDGFFVDLLALIPLELVYVAIIMDMDQVDPIVVSYLRCFRLLRIIWLLRNIKMQSQKLKTNHYLSITHVVLYMLMGLTCLATIFLLISDSPDLVVSKNCRVLNRNQFVAFVKSCEHVINFFGSANLYVLVPNSRTQIVLSIACALLLPYMKGVLISQTLSIMHANGLAKFNYKSQVVALESYLIARDTSPCIVKEVIDYKFNLLEFGRSENMPAFLEKCPAYLRIGIMRDLYLAHLQNCPLFENVDTIFLEQLLARMKREIYFSGQQIVEQFDVDHRIYFIHRGEVYVINQTKEKTYMEFVIGKMMNGEYFGEASGLWFSRPHPYTYRARTLVEVIVLHSDDWMDLRRCFPKTATLILEKAKALRIL